jgi:hypothetical protein
MALPSTGRGWILAFGLAVGAIASWLAFGSVGSTAFAEPSSGSGAMIAIARDGADGVQLLYLVDSSERTLCIYQFDPRKGKLKLAAARHLAADERLLEFNNDEPHVADIEKLVRSKEGKE